MSYSWLSVFFTFAVVSSCGGNDTQTQKISTEPDPTSPVNYTCGTLADNETCIKLNMPDNYSNERHFILNTPEVISDNAPLFIVLHGSGWRADKTVDRFLFRDFIKENNFIGIFPNSIIREDGISTWNAHNDTYGISHIDDINFIKKIITKAVTEYKADAKKVYLFGWSNGGFMSNRLACEIPEYLTAIFTLAGHVREELNSCSLAGNVAVQHLHATGDKTVPYEGEESLGYISAEEAIKRWVVFNRCDLDPLRTNQFDLTSDEVGDESVSYLYQNCDAPTDFTVITGSDHGPDFHIKTLHKQMLNFYQKSN
jgi:polyhydroxybutyrate depolymerase